MRGWRREMTGLALHFGKVTLVSALRKTDWRRDRIDKRAAVPRLVAAS